MAPCGQTSINSQGIRPEWTDWEAPTDLGAGSRGVSSGSSSRGRDPAKRSVQSRTTGGCNWGNFMPKTEIITLNYINSLFSVALNSLRVPKLHCRR